MQINSIKSMETVCYIESKTAHEVTKQHKCNKQVPVAQGCCVCLILKMKCCKGNHKFCVHAQR